MHFSATLFKNTEVFVIPQHLHLRDFCLTAHYFCGQSLFCHSAQWIPTSATSSNNIRKKQKNNGACICAPGVALSGASGFSSIISFVLYFFCTVLHTSSSQSVTPAHCDVQEHAKRYAALTRSSAPRVMKQASYFFLSIVFLQFE